MKEISLHILDIVQNSIRAQATEVNIHVIENTEGDSFQLKIEDNGMGMNPEALEKVLDPFYTTRRTRRVGLGLSLLKEAAEQCGGSLVIQSNLGKGTVVEAIFTHSHIDRAPLGNITETLITLILSYPDIDYIYTHQYNEKEFFFSTLEIRKVLGSLSITEFDVIDWLKKYIDEGLKVLVK